MKNHICNFTAKHFTTHWKVAACTKVSNFYWAIDYGTAIAGMAHYDCGWTCECAGKTVRSTCHTWALLMWWFTKRCCIKCTYLYLLTFYIQRLSKWEMIQTAARRSMSSSRLCICSMVVCQRDSSSCLSTWARRNSSAVLSSSNWQHIIIIIIIIIIIRTTASQNTAFSTMYCAMAMEPIAAERRTGPSRWLIQPGTDATKIHYYAALLPRRGPHIASHSVCPSVCPSVPVSLP